MFTMLMSCFHCSFCAIPSGTNNDKTKEEEKEESETDIKRLTKTLKWFIQFN